MRESNLAEGLERTQALTIDSFPLVTENRIAALCLLHNLCGPPIVYTRKAISWLGRLISEKEAIAILLALITNPVTEAFQCIPCVPCFCHWSLQ